MQRIAKVCRLAMVAGTEVMNTDARNYKPKHMHQLEVLYVRKQYDNKEKSESLHSFTNRMNAELILDYSDSTYRRVATKVG